MTTFETEYPWGGTLQSQDGPMVIFKDQNGGIGNTLFLRPGYEHGLHCFGVPAIVTCLSEREPEVIAHLHWFRRFLRCLLLSPLDRTWEPLETFKITVQELTE